MPLLKASRYLAALVLAIGAFYMSVAYVSMMHIVVTLLALVNAFFEKERGYGLFFWIFIGMALWYNPIFPIPMSGRVATGMNLGCALLWIISAPRVRGD